MFNKIYKFLNNDNLICHVQFGFRWKYSAVHVFISLTENIRKSLDEGNVGCGIFVDLQKSFDTVEHDILLSKLEHYGVCSLTDQWFKSYLSNRKLFFQSFVMVLILLSLNMMFLKDHFLVHFCFYCILLTIWTMPWYFAWNPPPREDRGNFIWPCGTLNSHLPLGGGQGV